MYFLFMRVCVSMRKMEGGGGVVIIIVNHVDVAVVCCLSGV
jgi:hypothetical protein